MFATGSNCWRLERADKVSVIVDAEDYFRVARDAMVNAKRRIVLVGWDFDARIKLVDAATDDDGPEKLGDFIAWLAARNPSLEFHLLRWDMGAVKTFFRGSTLITVLKWMRRPRIHTRLDGHHPFGASHHQKIVVIDGNFAFCGGIDMTGDRWDTRAHRDDDPGRHQPNGKPYKPWHDVTTAIQGPAAAVLGELCSERWVRAGGKALPALEPQPAYWPRDLPVQFNDVAMAIARSVPKMDDQDEVVEIERLYVDAIASAKRVIYAESQYFASRRVAEAIAARVAEEDGPEIVLINPRTADGWLQPIAMDSARARLVEAIRRKDRHGRFRIYHPVTVAGEPIYVHAKVMIVDDRMIRVGSSNLNNRSMRLDTECDVAIAAPPGETAVESAITAIRNSLLAEHLGISPDELGAGIDRHGSLIATIEASRGSGKTLEPYETPDLPAVERWLADNEVLDPEGPSEMFEATTKRGLFRRRR